MRKLSHRFLRACQRSATWRTSVVFCSVMSMLSAGFIESAVAVAAENAPAAVTPATTSPATVIASPLSPEASLAAFQLDPQLQIQLVAVEPQVIDPVAIHFGAEGSLWVVEMRDYPHGPANGAPPKSRIKQLQDRDGDGVYETAHVFADELLFVTGVLPYRDGLIVTLAGKVMFFADRDGDHQAEFRETWFSGFAQENSQLRANHPTYGPDGYVYIANGLRGGKVVAERPQWNSGSEPLTITGFDFRFHPETGHFSTVNGHGQFGMTFDDVGNRFVCTNRNPCIQIMLDDRYLRQNPRYGVRQVVQDVCLAGENSTLYPISRAWTTSTLHANQFTAACGVTIYRGSALPAEFLGNAFTCDPTGNLVHREVLTPAGATFAGRSPYQQREFLASPDTWFRPVNLAHGPDGALYVVDMYRAVIEHPDFMPTELKTRADLLHGTDRGRIYRIVPRGEVSKPRVQQAMNSTTELIDGLSHPNVFQREMALRHLLERPQQELSPALVSRALSAASPTARVLALQWLAQTEKPQLEWFKQGLRDASPLVRVTALRLSEPYLADATLAELVQERLKDESAHVRFQAVQSATLLDMSDKLRQALVQLARTDANDVWMRSAILTCVRLQSGELLAELLPLAAVSAADAPGLQTLCTDLATIVAGPDFDKTRGLVWQSLQKLPSTAEPARIQELRWSVLESLATVLNRRGQKLTQSPGFPPEAARMVQGWMADAGPAMIDASLPLSTRIMAIRVARFTASPEVQQHLMQIALEETALELQQAAFEVLATFPQPELAEPLLSRFSSAAPAARRGILDVLLANEARTATLVAALENGQLKPSELDPIRVQRLTNHRNVDLRNRSRKLMEAATAERGAVLAAYNGVLTMPADAVRGRAIFEKNCVTCHRVGELGVNVGPDIADSRTKTPDVLLMAILDPNRAIDNNFFGYTLVTVEGKVLTGIITAETSSSITLRQPEGKMETILRSDIEELRNTGASLMPVGFEKNIPPQQMADLISFLKNWRYLDGAVPLSQSE